MFNPRSEGPIKNGRVEDRNKENAPLWVGPTYEVIKEGPLDAMGCGPNKWNLGIPVPMGLCLRRHVMWAGLVVAWLFLWALRLV